MSKVLFSAALAVALLGMSGCLNERRSRVKYVSDGEVVSGVASDATVYDLDTAVQSLMTRMRANEAFLRSYGVVKTRCAKPPVLEIAPFVINFELGASKSKLELIRHKAGVSFFESELFVVRDAAVAKAGGLGAPDCQLQGYLTRVAERGGCYVYRLTFKLVDMKTATVMWSGDETVQKIN